MRPNFQSQASIAVASIKGLDQLTRVRHLENLLKQMFSDGYEHAQRDIREALGVRDETV